MGQAQAAMEDPQDGTGDGHGSPQSLLSVMEQLLEVTAMADRTPLQESLKVLKSAWKAKAALEELVQSKAEHLATWSSAPSKPCGGPVVLAVWSRLGAECATESVREIAPQRDEVLADHLSARNQHCEGALVQATSELKGLHQGRKEEEEEETEEEEVRIRSAAHLAQIWRHNQQTRTFRHNHKLRQKRGTYWPTLRRNDCRGEVGFSMWITVSLASL